MFGHSLLYSSLLHLMRTLLLCGCHCCHIFARAAGAGAGCTLPLRPEPARAVSRPPAATASRVYCALARLGQSDRALDDPVRLRSLFAPTCGGIFLTHLTGFFLFLMDTYSLLLTWKHVDTVQVGLKNSPAARNAMLCGQHGASTAHDRAAATCNRARRPGRDTDIHRLSTRRHEAARGGACLPPTRRAATARIRAHVHGH